MSQSITLEEFHKRMIKHKSIIIENVKNISNQLTSKTTNYKIIWHDLELNTIATVMDILQREFEGSLFVNTASKSTYPDLTMKYGKFIIAIDIKTSESEKDPWYDIARLDTLITKRINKFSEEYEIILKYDKKTGHVLNVYFELLRDTVGRNKDGGLKYRPYDGKLRPKSWYDFDNGISYWNSKKEFQDAIKIAQLHRYRIIIKNVLLPLLSNNEKQEFKKMFC